MVDIVNQITGDFGIWQLRTVLIIYLCKIPSSWFMACVIFTAPAPYDNEYYCKPPPGVQNHSEWINAAHPKLPDGVSFDYCNIHNNAYNKSLDVSRSETRKCENFEHSAEYHSLVMQFDLVCDREILVAWTQFWHLFGVLAGGIAATKLMDFLSPRRVMLTGMLSQIVCGCLTGLVNDFSLHCFFRMMSAVCCALMFTSGQTIFSEITGGKYRTGVCTLFDQFWSLGVVLLPGLSILFTSWTHLYLAISLPTLVLIFLYQWIPDAPRWLLRRGQVQQVETILMESVKINDRSFALPNDLKQELQMLSDSLKAERPPAGWWSLFQGPRAKINFVAAHIAFAVYVVNFNGMLLNIRSFGREYLEIDTIITGLSEMIGCFIALHLIRRTQHKWRWAGLYNIISGLIGCLGWFFPSTSDRAMSVSLWMLISSIEKAGVSISQSMLLACSAELVPPHKKQIFVFSCIVWARIWLLSAPFINVLKNVDIALSLTAFSLLGLLGGICTCCLGTGELSGNSPSQENITQHQPKTVWTISNNLVMKTKL